MKRLLLICLPIVLLSGVFVALAATSCRTSASGSLTLISELSPTGVHLCCRQKEDRTVYGLFVDRNNDFPFDTEIGLGPDAESARRNLLSIERWLLEAPETSMEFIDPEGRRALLTRIHSDACAFYVFEPGGGCVREFLFTRRNIERGVYALKDKH